MRFSVRHILAACVLLLFGGATQIGWAQFNSSVEGTVSDQTGAVVVTKAIVDTPEIAHTVLYTDSCS